MDLHGKIMNIRIDEKNNSSHLADFPEDFADAVNLAYKLGHRDARHAAAELAVQHNATLNECMELLAQITHASHQQAISNHQESIILKLARKKSASWLKSNGYKIVKG